MTAIRQCTCVSPFQDRMYGLGKRVMNEGNDKFRCTVCGKEQATPKKAPAKKEDGK